MAALSKYDKQRIVFLKERGLRNCSNNEAWRSCARYVESRSIARRQGSGTLTLCTGALLQTIDNIIQADDEATAVHIHSACCRETRSCYYSAWFCVPDANWARRTEGQCQLIRQANKEKHLEWACADLHDNFERCFMDRWIICTATVLQKILLQEEQAALPKAPCQASHQSACMDWNRMAWSYRNLHYWWHNGCSNVRQDSAGSSPAHPSTSTVWKRYNMDFGTAIERMINVK